MLKLLNFYEFGLFITALSNCEYISTVRLFIFALRELFSVQHLQKKYYVLESDPLGPDFKNNRLISDFRIERASCRKFATRVEIANSSVTCLLLPLSIIVCQRSVSTSIPAEYDIRIQLGKIRNHHPSIRAITAFWKFCYSVNARWCMNASNLIKLIRLICLMSPFAKLTPHNTYARTRVMFFFSLLTRLYQYAVDWLLPESLEVHDENDEKKKNEIIWNSIRITSRLKAKWRKK